MSEFQAQAVVTVTVEVPCGTYGPEWKIEDIRKQAAKEGVENIQNALSRDPMKYGSRMRVQSSTLVRVVINEDKP